MFTLSLAASKARVGGGGFSAVSSSSSSSSSSPKANFSHQQSAAVGAQSLQRECDAHSPHQGQDEGEQTHRVHQREG